VSTHDDRYTHGHHESVLRSHRWRTAENSAAYLLPHLAPGGTLLDVGCGPGNLTADLARHLGTGTVIGVDRAADVIAAAATEFGGSPGADLSFVVDDGYGLSMENATVDIVHAHQVLQHLSDPVAALREWRRVLRPGGLLAVRDADFLGMAFGPSSPALVRWMDLYHAVTRANGAEADGGRHLATWVLAAGFTDLVVSSSTWTFATAEERSFWGGLWADRVLQSEFATQALAGGFATHDDLLEISEAFTDWSANPAGTCFVLHGEVLARA